MKKLNFRELLLEYYFILCGTKEQFARNMCSKEEFNARRYVNMEWFHCSREYLPEKAVFSKCKEKRKLSRKKFLLPEDQRCPGCEDGKPLYILKYRGLDIPVYDDDYGQQEFAYFDGKSISGGCYNFFAEYEFISYIDHYLENKYLEGTYDIHKEIEDLYNKDNV